MMRRHKIRAISYYVRCTATHRLSGETSVKSYGPFATFQQAAAFEREDDLPHGNLEYFYEYRIDTLPTGTQHSLD
jgi:hypothetical protein